MNINDLPQELILEIFSYLSQQDLFKLYSTVSDLWTQISLSSEFWKSVNFIAVYGSHSLCFEHFKMVKNFIHSLVIDEKQLNEFFERYYDNDTNLHNLESLCVSSVCTKKLAYTIVNSCPLLKDLRISDGIQLDIHNCCEAFYKLNLVSFDIHYYDSDRDKTRDDLLRFIHSQKGLRKLGIRTFPYIDETVTQIINAIPMLKSLYISECVSNVAFFGITKKLNIEELIIHSDRVTDEGLDFVTKISKQLKLLDVRLCADVTDSGISYVAKNCPLLEKLSVGNIFPKQHIHISSACLHSLSQGCPNLTYLSVTGCVKIDDDGITAITRSCKDLRILILKGCSEITDQSVYAVSSCLVLHKLDLTECVNISLSSIIHLLNVHKKLKTLILSYCDGIRGDDDKDDNSSNAVDINKGKRKRFSKSQRRFNYDCSVNAEKIETFDVQSGSGIAEVNLKGSKNMTKTAVLTLVKHCPVITRLTLPNNSKMKTDDQFIRNIFTLCTYLNRCFMFGQTIKRNRYI